MFKNHPKGLIVLALTNMGERFGYYTMIAVLALYMQAKFGLSSSYTSVVYGTFLALVYFLPLLGGFIADKMLGYGKTIILGIAVLFGGYLLLALPVETDAFGKVMMYCALFLISVGTGFFKGNLQALVGKLYEPDAYKSKSSVAFSIFYMFINIGAFFAPSVANTINNAFLAKENFTYDAAIAKNYVALNDRVVDENTFVMQALEGKQALGDREKAKIVKSAKKDAGVMFESDRAAHLFRLKAAGLRQLTMSGKITGESMKVSESDYALLDSRRTEDAASIAALKSRINAVKVTDAALYGDPDSPDMFSENFGKSYVDNSLSKSYNLAFSVACFSLVISLLVFMLFRRTWKAADKTHRQQLKEAGDTAKPAETLSKEQVRERIIALLLVFFVVIFFWMSFHQNGLCMTFFARDYTASQISPAHNIVFSLMGLLPLIAVIYGIYLATVGLFGGRRNPVAGSIVALTGIAGLTAYYFADVKDVTEMITITPQIFQQFNPLFIVLLTPLSIAFFTYLEARGKEPSAPRKIGYGMLIAAAGFIVLLVASLGLAAPEDINGISDVLVSPDWLIGSYLILTLAELFLSPMGMAFVAKVAPPQYKGMMQGGWLAATATGNLLVGVMGAFWDKLQLYVFWGVLIICCILSATFIFSIIRRLENATK